MKALLISAAIALVTVSQSVIAQGFEHSRVAQAEPENMTSGEIRKVDMATGKLTIKHEDIKNLSMPAMTMVFKASSPDLLNGVKTGDKVKFVAAMVNGVLMVTKVEEAK